MRHGFLNFFQRKYLFAFIFGQVFKGVFGHGNSYVLRGQTCNGNNPVKVTFELSYVRTVYGGEPKDYVVRKSDAVAFGLGF